MAKKPSSKKLLPGGGEVKVPKWRPRQYTTIFIELHFRTPPQIRSPTWSAMESIVIYLHKSFINFVILTLKVQVLGRLGWCWTLHICRWASKTFQMTSKGIWSGMSWFSMIFLSIQVFHLIPVAHFCRSCHWPQSLHSENFLWCSFHFLQLWKHWLKYW